MQRRDALSDTFDELMRKYTAEELGSKSEKTRRGRLQEFKPLVKVFGAMSPEDIEPHKSGITFRPAVSLNRPGTRCVPCRAC